MDRRKRIPERDGDSGKSRKRRKAENSNGGWLSSITSYVKKNVPKNVETFLFGEEFEDLSDEEERREKKRVVVFEETSTNVMGNFKYPKIAKLSSQKQQQHFRPAAPQIVKHDRMELKIPRREIPRREIPRKKLNLPQRFFIQRGACRIDIESLKFKWLRQECVRRDLNATGSKAVLLNRLREYLIEEFKRENGGDVPVADNSIEEETHEEDLRA